MKLKFNSESKTKRKKEDGLTLLECLVAISVIALTSGLIAPIMVFSVATRVQSQKAEQALQLAQLEVDSIRVEVERGNYKTFLDGYPKTNKSESEIATTPAPTSMSNTLNNSDVKVARGIDVDQDGEDDFAVQVFRTEGIEDSSDNTPLAFRVGVRIYDVDALINNSGSLLLDSASLSFTSGEGERSRRPLAVVYSDVTSSDQDLSLCNYRSYLDASATVNDDIDCS